VWLGGRRLIAIDGTSLDVADTPENSAFFGRPGVNKGEQAAFPQARVVAVAECGTHAIFDAAVGTYTTPENTLAGEVIDRLEPGTLLLADRGFCGFPLWSRAVATGAHLLVAGQQQHEATLHRDLVRRLLVGRAPPERRGKRQGPTTDHPGHRLPDR